MTRSHERLNEWVMAHVALLVEGQSRLSEIVGTDTPEWDLSISTGLMNLNGHRLQYALLGSVNESDNTWLWSWADGGLPASSVGLQRALPLRGFGEEYGLWEFAESSFSMEGVVDLGLTAGSSIALVASPQIMGGAIFSGAYPGGRLYAVITDPQLTEEQPTAVTASRYLNAARLYSPNSHRDLVGIYCAAHGLDYQEIDEGMVIGFEDGSSLDVVFDEDGCIDRMHGEVPASYNAALTNAVEDKTVADDDESDPETTDSDTPSAMPEAV